MVGGGGWVGGEMNIKAKLSPAELKLGLSLAISFIVVESFLISYSVFVKGNLSSKFFETKSEVTAMANLCIKNRIRKKNIDCLLGK